MCENRLGKTCNLFVIHRRKVPFFLIREKITNPMLPPGGEVWYWQECWEKVGILQIFISDAHWHLCLQVNGNVAKEATRDSKVSVSPSPSNASSNASLTTPPANTPPEVTLHKTTQSAALTLVRVSLVFLLACFSFNREQSQTPSRLWTWRCSRSKSSPTRNAPTREPRPWTGPRKTNSSATYRASPETHTHTQSNQTDFLKIIIIILKKSSSLWVNYSFYYALHAIITQILCYKMSYYQEKCICQWERTACATMAMCVCGRRFFWACVDPRRSAKIPYPPFKSLY